MAYEINPSALVNALKRPAEVTVEQVIAARAASTANPPITKAVQLVAWTCSDQLIWPPPRPSIAALYATSMVPQRDQGFSAHWAAAQKEDNLRRAATEERWAEEEAARQEESRRAYEASLRR